MTSSWELAGSIWETGLDIFIIWICLCLLWIWWLDHKYPDDQDK